MKFSKTVSRNSVYMYEIGNIQNIMNPTIPELLITFHEVRNSERAAGAPKK